MDFTSKTVLGIFDASQKTFVIPVYQRAYSWDEDNWKAFYNDLKEQISGKNKYFMGNLLLEVIKKDQEYEIIDGQQRLTTIVLFIHSILDVMEKRLVRPSNGSTIKSKKRIYLENEGVVKLRPVDYDRPFFNKLISGGAQQLKTTSPSQELMKKAITFFTKKLQGESDGDLVGLLSKLEETEITTVELAGKRESALMFELQNNRGKELTNMEKLKSFFMYQTYVRSSTSELEKNVSDLSTLFEQIYMTIKDLEHATEDNVLIYHCQAYINGFSYRSIDEIKDEYRKHKSLKWINDFVCELHTSFQSIKKLECLKSTYWKLLNQVKDGVPAFVYPFIIKAYKCFEDKTSFERFFHVMENLAFRFYLINSRADFRSRLNELLNDLDGSTDLDSFIIKTRNKMNGTDYWSDSRLKEQLGSRLYGNSIVHYLLWRYENSLQLKGYDLKTMKIKDESIEHISPQTPGDGEPLASGYELEPDGGYPDDFDKYLHSIGNLLLISKSHNSSIGNSDFSSKLKSFVANPLLKQQAELERFVSGKGKTKAWDHEAIEKRTEVISAFAIRNWSFDEI